MTGSKKQIAWAEELRDEWDRLVRGKLQFAKKGATTEAQKQTLVSLGNAHRATMDTQMEASWWIDNRETRWDIMAAKGAGLIK